MQYFLDQFSSGLAIGAIYGLVAMGFAVIFKATGVINFAQGEITMLVAYVAYTLAGRMPGNAATVIVLSLLAAMAIGWLVERVVMRPMLGEPAFATVMVTIGLAVVIRALVGMVWDAYPRRLDLAVGQDGVRLGATGMRSGQIAAIVTLLAAMAAGWLALRHSRLGKAMRAVASDHQASMLMGIDAGQLHSLAWVIASLIAGISGIFFALLYDVGPTIFHLGLKAFPATIFGGLDSVLGSALGGLVVGVVENLASGYLDPASKEIAGFVLIVMVLMVRPWGLFGERDIERV